MGDIALDFSRKEFACRCGCGFDTVDVALLDVLVDLRSHFGAAVTVNCGCRCAKHNAEVGGAPASQHMLGRAADVVVVGVTPAQVAAYLELCYPTRYGIFRYPTFTHIDTRAKKARGDFTNQAKGEAT